MSFISYAFVAAVALWVMLKFDVYRSDSTFAALCTLGTVMFFAVELSAAGGRK